MLQVVFLTELVSIAGTLDMASCDEVHGIDLDRVASRAERYVAMVMAVALCLVFAAVSPWASRPGPEIQGFMPLFAGAMIVIDAVLAVLLFSKGAIGGRASPIRLGTAYLFGAMIIGPHVAAFPGAIVPAGLLGTSATAVWLWSFWHAGFAVAIMRHVLGRTIVPQRHAILRAVIVTAVSVTALTLFAALGQGTLPAVLSGNAYHTNAFSLGLQILVVLLTTMALILVGWRLRLRTAEDLWLTIAMLAACVDVGLTVQAGSRFSLGWYAGRAANLVTSLVVLVSLFCDIMQLYGAVARANVNLARLAHLDGLTGLANRRQLDNTITVEFRRARRDARPLSVVMIDVDHFKAYNDRYGHQDGDQCLRLISACLSERVLRPGDLVARYGGEEFALLLPSTDLHGALYVADGVRTAVRALGLVHDGSPVGVVTVSVGAASIVPHDDDQAEHVVAQADAALYRAKQAGRDQVWYAGTGRYLPLELGRFDSQTDAKVA